MTEGPVRDTRAMIAGMRPVLMPGLFVFCAAPADMAIPPQGALAAFHEDEGLSLILPVDRARDAGLTTEPAMRLITLMVHSDLEGLGLTAAVATALAAEGIACNVVAALRHDHVFVPAAMAEPALAALERLAVSAR
jgi:uncharacterized protein